MRMPDSVTLREHLSALREADLKFQAERDRRYTEVARERERALLIKETADKAALDLARQINDLHLAALNGEQSRLLADRERFVSRDVFEEQQKTLTEWRDTVNSSLNIGTGQQRGVATFWGVLIVLVGMAISVVSLILVLR